MRMRSLVGRLSQDKRVRYATAGLAAALVVIGVAAAAVANTASTHRRTVVSDQPAQNIAVTTSVTSAVTTSDDGGTTTTAAAVNPTVPGSASVTTPTTEPCTTCLPRSGWGGADAQPGDFDGRVIVQYFESDRTATHATVGDRLQIGVDLRNSSDHVVDVGSPAVLCATDLTPEGHTNHALNEYPYLWWLTLGPFDPGQAVHDFPRATIDLTANDVGTMTCEAVLIEVGHGAPTGSQRITRIAPVSFTVTPVPPTTQPPTNATSTSTTLGP